MNLVEEYKDAEVARNLTKQIVAHGVSDAQMMNIMLFLALEMENFSVGQEIACLLRPRLKLLVDAADEGDINRFDSSR